MIYLGVRECCSGTDILCIDIGYARNVVLEPLVVSRDGKSVQQALPVQTPSHGMSNKKYSSSNSLFATCFF